MSYGNVDGIRAQQTSSSQSVQPSDGGQGNPYAPFFGGILDATQYPANRDLLQRNYDLPAAYAKQSTNHFLTDVVDGLVAIDNNWATTVCLPLTYSDEMNHTWDTFIFTQPLADQVPHEGTVRVLQHGKYTRTESTLRRGLGLYFEVCFFQCFLVFGYANA